MQMHRKHFTNTLCVVKNDVVLKLRLETLMALFGWDSNIILRYPPVWQQFHILAPTVHMLTSNFVDHHLAATVWIMHLFRTNSCFSSSRITLKSIKTVHICVSHLFFWHGWLAVHSTKHRQTPVSSVDISYRTPQKLESFQLQQGFAPKPPGSGSRLSYPAFRWINICHCTTDSVLVNTCVDYSGVVYGMFTIGLFQGFVKVVKNVPYFKRYQVKYRRRRGMNSCLLTL